MHNVLHCNGVSDGMRVRSADASYNKVLELASKKAITRRQVQVALKCSPQAALNYLVRLTKRKLLTASKMMVDGRMTRLWRTTDNRGIVEICNKTIVIEVKPDIASEWLQPKSKRHLGQKSIPIVRNTGLGVRLNSL